MKPISILLTVALVMLSAGALAEDRLILPEGVKIIEESAFAGDTSLDTVVLPEGIEVIGAGAFAGSTLKRINLPASLKSIDDTALGDPDQVTVDVQKGTTAYEWALKNGYVPAEPTWPESEHPYPRAESQSWEYTHPTDAAALLITFSEDTALDADEADTLCIQSSGGDYQEYEGSELAGVTIDVKGSRFTMELEAERDTVQSGYGFKITNIRGLTEEEYQDWLGGHPFSYMGNGDGTLTVTAWRGSGSEAIVPASIDGMPVTGIYGFTWEFDDSIERIVVEEGVKYLYGLAINECANLREVILPESLVSIGKEGIAANSNLERVYIPGAHTTLGNDALGGCRHVTIYGKAGSPAETYAREYSEFGVSFVAI